MALVPGSGRVRLSLKILVPLALVVLVLSVFPFGLAYGASAPAPAPKSVNQTGHAAAPTAAPPSTAFTSRPQSGTSPTTHVLPSVNSGTATFYQNTSGFAVPPHALEGCGGFSFSTYVYNYCYPQAVDPTLVSLGSGNVGLGYQFNTNASSLSCSSLTSNVHTRIGFSVSTNNGGTFGTPTVIGNNSCAYLQAIEPAFATSGNSVYGAFVEENYTSNQPGYYYAPRSGDALAFVSSSNNGATFQTPVTLNFSGNISHPEIAAFGNSIYIVFMNITTSTTYVNGGGPFCYGFCTTYPAAVYFTASTNGGSTWSTPKMMPGMNSTVSDFSINPSIAVNATGTLAVSYFTNESCAYSYAFYGCMDYGLDLQVFTSATNGTSWKGPYTVERAVGETHYYFGYSFTDPVSQWVPQVKLIFDPTGQTIFMTWSGGFNQSDAFANLPYDIYCCAGIFFASGSISGSSWTVTPVKVSYSQTYFDDFYNPSVADVGGTLYLTYTWNNESGCYTGSCPYLTGTLNQRITYSQDGGLTWSLPGIAEMVKSSSYCYSACATNQFEGYQSSVLAGAGNTPLIAYSLPQPESFTYANIGGINFYNYTYPTLLAVAQPYVGPTVTLNATVHNLPPGTVWTFEVMGQAFSTTSQSFYVTDIPLNQSFTVSPDNIAAGYGEQVQPESSVPSGIMVLSTNGTIFFNYSVSYQLLLFINPAIAPYFEVYSNFNGTFYEVYGGFYCYPTCYFYRDWYLSSPYTYGTSPIPWYVPSGSVITFQQYSYSSAYVDYWNGTGAHAYNGSGTMANITMDSPVNETGWIGGFGTYNETFRSVGLPSTSTYTFSFNGKTYSSPSTKNVTVATVPNGGYPITNITATSSTAGWEYFGLADTGRQVIIPAQPIVNLTFADVDLATSPGTVTFHAVGLTTGTVWHFAFNGTEYSSSTPWINVTTRAGTFPVAAYPVTSANGSAGYTPTGVSSTWSVTPLSSYDVNYLSAYRVVATAGIGGTIAGPHGTLWYAAGANASFHATVSGAYAFGGWTGTGLGSYTGPSTYANLTSIEGPIYELASFYPLPQNRFNLTFVETGLTPGTWWTVYLSGTGYSTNLQTLRVANLYPCGPLGNYNLSIPYVYLNGTSLVRFTPGSYHATVCTTGVTTVNVGFTPQYYLSLGETAGGIAQAQIGANSYTSSLWVQNGSSVLLSPVLFAGYQFLGWNGTGAGSYTGPTASVGLVMANPMSEVAAFAHPYIAPAPRYWVSFHLTAALAPGTAWTVHVGGTGYSSTGTTLNVTGLLAQPSYTVSVTTAYSPDGLTRYTPLGAPTSLPVTHNQTVSLTYSTSYWMSISASYGGIIAQPTTTSGWIVSGQVVNLNATPNDGYVFIGWTGTGSGSYTGTDAVTTIHISSPTTEFAGFAPAPPASKVVTTNSVWSAPTTWVGLAVGGLLVGLVVGLLMGRRGGSPPRPAVSDQPWSEGPTDSSGAPMEEETAAESPPVEGA